MSLITLLDELRDLYELAKEARQSELQARLMHVRRSVLDAVHQSISLHAENAELQEQITELRAQNEQLRATVESAPRLENAILHTNVRKIS